MTAAHLSYQKRAVVHHLLVFLEQMNRLNSDAQHLKFMKVSRLNVQQKGLSDLDLNVTSAVNMIEAEMDKKYG